MKSIFQKEFEQLNDCVHNPNSLYGHLINLAGMVFNSETDKEIEEDLKNLSITHYNFSNSTIGQIKDIVHEIVFWTKQERNNRLPDIEHLIHQHRDANLDQINTLIYNLAQLNNLGNNGNENRNIEQGRQVRIEADFSPLLRQLEQLLKEIKPQQTFELNIPKIIGFITTRGIEKGYLTQNETND